MKETKHTKMRGSTSLTLAALLTVASSASAQLITTTENQNSDLTFTPTWTVPTTSNLIYGLAPTAQDGNFTLEGAGGITHLNDGVIGPVSIQGSWINIYATCGNGSGAGASITYTLPASENGYNITNITVYSGWGNNGRDAQAYNVSYSTKEHPTSFTSLGYVSYNPNVGANRPSINRSVLTDWAGGAIASNVYALRFTFNAQGVENGYAGYSEITVLGVPATAPASSPVVISTETEYGNNTVSWTIESTSSLIYNQTPSAFGPGDAQRDGDLGIMTLTWGDFGSVDSNQSYASLGGSPSVSTLTYSLDTASNPDGYDLTNIVSYSGWADGGLDGQFYTVSYSTVAAPSQFVPLTSICFNPPRTNNLPMANRVAISRPGTVLARNVAAVKFDFAAESENGRCQYAELVVQGNPSATPSLLAPAPILVSSGPATATSIVGDKVTFSATLDGTIPASYQWQKDGVNIPGATQPTLTLNNVQTGDAGYYRLTAFNGTNNTALTYTPLSKLIVTGMPQATNNIIIKYVAQTGYGNMTDFTPTWETPGFSLISGQANPTVGNGNFNDPDSNPMANNQAGGVSVLTDGSIGHLDNATDYLHPTFATCGVNGAGNSITYILGAATQGYDVTNIQVYGGWNNAGRDQQKFTVRYSTVAAPASFNTLATVDYNPSNPANAQSMTRATIVPASGALVQSAYAIMFDFNMGGSAAKNGYEGYSEIVVGGTPTLVPPPILIEDINPQGASDVVGGQLTLTASFSGAASYQWKKDGISIPGATSPTLTLSSLQLTNSGIYTLVASNPGGTSSSRGCSLTVNPVATPVGNVVTAIATQNSDIPVFMPTWVLSTNASLIAGQSPSSSGGNFNMESQVGDRNVNSLTAGGTLALYLAGDPVSTCSNYVTAGNGLGSFLVYTLGESANGYDLTNIVVFGGWADNGRDQQAYTVRYSTVSNPTTFQPLAVVNYNPTLASGIRSAVRETLTAATGVLASNVYAVKFDFTTPGVENGYSGYAAINVLGTPSGTPPPAPVIATENQNTSSPTWVVEQNNLIRGQLPSATSDGAFAGSFNGDAPAGGLPVLTDGTFGPTDNGVMNFATCGGAFGAGGWIVYTCPTHSWTLTNIVVYSGWGNYARDGQFYDISYTTPEDPTTWIPLLSLDSNPVDPGVGGSSSYRVAISGPNGGVLATNVAQIKFDFRRQNGSLDNGYSGYAEIVLQGNEVSGPSLLPVIATEHQQGSFNWSVEQGSLIHGQLPSSTGSGSFTLEGCNVTNLTDGTIGFGAAFGASCGGDGVAVPSIVYNSTNGWNLTNIIVYTLWSDYGRDGQFYNISYSTLAAPATFLPLAGVAYNPDMPHNILSANRVSIAPPVGQTMLASNVAAVKFDFTPQGSQDYGWSGYTEILLLGSNMTPAVKPTLSSWKLVDGNLNLVGTGTPNGSYTVLTTTNVALPLSQWTTNSTGVFDANGKFSASIPAGGSKTTGFFLLKTP